MRTETQSLRLRIYLRISDWLGRTRLHTALVRRAKEMGLLGATVLPAFQGFGKQREITTIYPDVFSPDCPLVVEIVDDPEAIRRFVPIALEMAPDATLATTPVRRIICRKPESPANAR
jgi:PII-like signaling protein